MGRAALLRRLGVWQVLLRLLDIWAARQGRPTRFMHSSLNAIDIVMNTPFLVTLAVYLAIAGCRPSMPPEASSPQPSPADQVAQTDRAPLRRALNHIQFYLSDLEGRLKISNAQTWNLEASTARNALGNIELEVGVLRQEAQNVGRLESLLSQLDDNLRGATADNWGQNATAAQQSVGSIRLELQNLNRRLPDSDRERR